MGTGVMEQELIFAGEYEHQLDSQRRVSIPSAWRHDEGESRFFLLPGRNHTLQLIPFESFRAFLEKARNMPFANADSSLALARLGSRSQDCRCDRQGRIQIPQRLLEGAALGTQLLLVGAITTIQIWNPEQWRKLRPDDEDSFFDEIQKIGESQGDLSGMLLNGLLKR
jgi:MraZ protein